ncbi:hypothetical protein RO3G_13582 [Rhizopus delemar RA 99-880]|uniref:Uncharacterized protein n=1 Tax=Rhizopus delemar (strain RA 99-880 / ATCC MYA-4621 / FGSC 9543 / NRRL 43880) TaxID=246409 RepID=I1CK91_RHIO9|nr:hypothetical protein RO3G_13582 [Rhizopus delemar RA 99-880]|eukprot:EIE88871.1 hypothetical protein RO3G_13582 [Rhizopus delemar RA 99-880]
MSARIFIECTRHLAISEDETREKMTELVGLNKSTVSSLSRKQTERPLKKLFNRMSIDLTSSHTEQSISLD